MENLLEFIKTASEEDLIKLAETYHAEYLEKIAQRVAEIILEKVAEAEKEVVEAPVEAPIVLPTPVTGVPDNTDANLPVDGSITRPELLDATEEAIIEGHADKVIQLVKQIFESKGPEHAAEAVKGIKTVISTLVVSGKMEQEAAVALGQELNAIVGG